MTSSRAPVPHAGAPVPGDRIGPYRIVRQLGSGGMGTVYEAADDSLRRHVALKVIAPQLASDPAFRARFVREAQAQASLDSPHVVQVFAHGEVGGRLYIASQLVPDGDLGAMLQRHGPPPPQLGVDLIAQVADGLAEAHRHGLVHRDIKPANVLVRNRGTHTTAYLADFGIARHVSAGHSVTTDFAAGTPLYMAPELHRGQPAGPSSDVYSLGCLLWATLTGRAPYAGTTDHQVAEAHVAGPVPQLPARSAYERELNRILATALAKDPRERYPSAGAFRDDLRSLGAAGTRAGRVSAGAVAAGVVGLVALFVAVVVTVLLVGRDGGVPAAGGDRSSEPASSSSASATASSTATSPATRSPEPSGSSGSREEQAVANIAQTLAEQGDLDAAGAECTARQLVEKRGVDGLQEAGLLDDDLMLVQDGDGDVDPKVLADIFTSTFSCLWTASTQP